MPLFDKDTALCCEQTDHAVHQNVQCPAHVHARMEIIAVDEGTLHVTVSGQEYAVEQGSGIFVAPFEAHSFCSRTPNHCRILEFSTGSVPAFFERLRSGTPESRIFPVPPECFALMDKFLPHDRRRPDILHAQAVLLPLCCSLCDHIRFAPAAPRYEDSFLAALDHIDRFCTQPELTLESTAAAVGLHPVTLSKKFARSAQVGFHTYLRHRRTVHAARLLEDPACTVTDAAFLSGFGSLRSFNRAFIQLTGLTPSQFRSLPEPEKSRRLTLFI